MMATQSEQNECVYKEGILEKRQRGRNHPNTDNLKFQKRYCELTSGGFNYYKDKKVGPIHSSISTISGIIVNLR